MAVDFSAYLSKPVGDITAPKALPVGHYFARVKSYEPVESSKAKKPMLKVVFTIDSAGEDVDNSMLPPAGVAGKSLTNNFMLDSEYGQFAIKQMIAAAGIEMDDAQGIGTYLPQLQNMPVKLYVENRPMNDESGQPLTNDDGTPRLQEDIKKILSAA